jgi:hypothetical protein
MDISRAAIASIEPLIRPYVRRTPVVEARGADFGLDIGTLAFKLELLQHSGSFKARGAFTNLLTREVPAAGVVAASGGNHGAAVAYAAQKLGRRARIYVPTVSSPAKIERIRSYGADLVVVGERYADALAESEKWAAQSGALQIHAFDQAGALLGQGTVGLEFSEQAPQLDTLLVAVGGGGLIGGIAAWYERPDAIDERVANAHVQQGRNLNARVPHETGRRRHRQVFGFECHPAPGCHVGAQAAGLRDTHLPDLSGMWERQPQVPGNRRRKIRQDLITRARTCRTRSGADEAFGIRAQRPLLASCADPEPRDRDGTDHERHDQHR